MAIRRHIKPQNAAVSEFQFMAVFADFRDRRFDAVEMSEKRRTLRIIDPDIVADGDFKLPRGAAKVGILVMKNNMADF